MITDTHAHVFWDSFDDDRDEVLARAREAGVERMVVVGTDLATSRACFELCAARAGLYPTAGIHPHDAEGGPRADLEAIEELCRAAGLRRRRRDRARLLQGVLAARRRSGERSAGTCELARELDKPVDRALPRRARGHARAPARGPGRARRDALLHDGPRGAAGPTSSWAATSPSRAWSPTRATRPTAPRRARCPRSGCWSRPTAPSSRRRGSAAGATSRPSCARCSRSVARERGVAARGAGARDQRQRRARCSASDDAGAERPAAETAAGTERGRRRRCRRRPRAVQTVRGAPSDDLLDGHPGVAVADRRRRRRCPRPCRGRGVGRVEGRAWPPRCRCRRAAARTAVRCLQQVAFLVDEEGAVAGLCRRRSARRRRTTGPRRCPSPGTRPA